MKAVVFDMDGVIIDSEWLGMDSWIKIGEKYEIPNVEECCKKCLGINGEAARRVFLEYYGEEFPYDSYKQEASDLFHKREKEELKLKLGAQELLQWLKNRGYRIGLATSTREAVAKPQLESLGVLSYFDEIVCGDMLKKSKPEPDIYLMACEILQVSPKDSYAIEDSYHGICAAYSAGMKAIMVPDMIEPNEDMREKSTVILKNLIEVKNWIEKKYDFSR